MGTDLWVANASPLIFLGKAGLYGLLLRSAPSIVIPIAVRDEIVAGPGGAELLEGLKNDARVRFCPNVAVSPGLLTWDLGSGETQVIAMASDMPGAHVVLDDLQARRCARAGGLKIIGTLGIVGRAKRTGIIGSAKPVIERLRQAGMYASDALVMQILKEVGEC